MSQALNACRTISHASSMRGAPALAIVAPQLSKSLLRPLSHGMFFSIAAALLQETPKAAPMPPKWMSHRTRPHRYRTKLPFAWPVYHQKPTKFAVARTNNIGTSIILLTYVFLSFLAATIVAESSLKRNSPQEETRLDEILRHEASRDGSAEKDASKDFV
ncbi:hypothetical protein DE146DRAFT_763366 [Phaeosphaeria sp. MPI-PUGE-AT-0046c]|nr:hypothetical protein DE146DRAFT_763366 [Phaeosphaeria sp. MPI-PUGE-AT-0046c]